MGGRQHFLAAMKRCVLVYCNSAGGGCAARGVTRQRRRGKTNILYFFCVCDHMFFLAGLLFLPRGEGGKKKNKAFFYNI